MRRILLLLPTTSYRNAAFLAAGKALDVEIVTCADYCHRLAPSWGLPATLSLPFDRPEVAIKTLLRIFAGADGFARRKLDAVLAVDDAGLELAALLNQHLALPGNQPAAVRRLRDKLAFRELLQTHRFNCPTFVHLPDGENIRPPTLSFPLVVKPRRLSASRGVIRADNDEEFMHAIQRAREIQRRADRDAVDFGLVVEAFIPGREYALEGLLIQGGLRVLALFDKPDPLDGPFFEETLYLTPSRLSPALQQTIAAEVERACRVADITSGPVHAEMRVNQLGVWLLEIAARSIGGQCSDVLKHTLGMSLEELIMRHALGLPLPNFRIEAEPVGASGVMMMPIAKRGIFRGARNVGAALNISGISAIQVTAQINQLLVPLPEGASYLGFIFAHAATTDAVEAALRSAHQALVFDIDTALPVLESLLINDCSDQENGK
ncbi:MAG: ATP-grasp domain-containing protein [Burkholderiales bacterium]|nr:ATP-grasp domain-containing protein [Burkholderiales bacterium]